MATVRIRPFDRERDEALFRACIIELQEIERTLDPRLPRGVEMVDAYTDAVLQRCAEWDGGILVAYGEDGASLGIATVYAHVPGTEADEPPGTYALLNDLVVLPDDRGRGAGRALLEAAESFCRERGAGVLRLEVMAGNDVAIAFYGRAGLRSRVIQMEKRL